MTPVVDIDEKLPPDDIARVLALAARSDAYDHAPPLNEQMLLDLGRSSSALTYAVARNRRLLVGVGIVEPIDDGWSAALMVDPAERGRGVGAGILAALLEIVDGSLVKAWAHGDLPAAQRLAEQTGFARVRELLVMRRDLGPDALSLPEPRWADGVSVRPFTVGRDEDAWLALNAAAFADHPEQAWLTRSDLDERMRGPWFDPDGFFLAERAGRLVGFHWTKAHGPDETGEPDRVGEIYVLGVDPSAQRLGLGKALALHGIRYLLDRGLPAVMLYVEASNPTAVGLYDRLGFRHAATDALYERPSR